MAKITYLFGAGASANALPTVNQIPDRMGKVIDLLKQPEFQLSETEHFQNQKCTKAEVQKMLIEDLEWLLEKSKNHASIDTFAKKLYIKDGQYGNNDLNRLKVSFSAYLSIEQYLNSVDKRYDTFFAALLGKYYKNQLPPEVRIITWNYDSQFEIAFSDYVDNNNLADCRKKLNFITKFAWNKDYNEENHKCCVLQLNGTTQTIDDSWHREYSNMYEYATAFSKIQLEKIIQRYEHLRNIQDYNGIRLFSGLSFAWEEDNKENREKNIVELTKYETQYTEILIVIGYSFPYFNREIDREIIRNMSKLQKVYFQAPDANNLQERFLSIREDIKPDKLISRFDTEQFLIPNEL